MSAFDPSAPARQIDDLPRASRLSRAIAERPGMRDDNDDFGTIGTELPR